MTFALKGLAEITKKSCDEVCNSKNYAFDGICQTFGE